MGCHGVFGTRGIDPNEICLSIPSEQVPALCQNLELWSERGKKMYQEAPPNEARESTRAPYDAEYTKDNYKKPGYVLWDEKLESPYESWAERRNRKGLYVP